MSKYYNIRFTLKVVDKNIYPEVLCLFSQPSLDDIKNKFVRAYLKKQPFFFKSKPISFETIDSITITETNNEPSAIARAQIDAASRNGVGIYISAEDAAFDEENPSQVTNITDYVIEEVQGALVMEMGFEPSEIDKHLHKSIKTVAYQKYLDGHFADAVESACKEINDRLKKLYKKLKGTEKDGNKLFPEVFNDNETTTLLKVDDLNTDSGKDEQAGYRFLLMGMWSAFRNPKAHANLTLTQDEAYDRLIFASMLMKRIDKAIDFTFKE